jgi:cytochrome c biogenesis protein CcmG/thiol:disulfide interchange protein DsbE
MAASKKILIGVAGLVLVLFVAAIVATSRSGDKKEAATGVEETRPVTVTGAALPKFEAGGTDAAVGQTIPELKGQSFDGSPVDIRNDGRAKLVLFVAHWCPHCQREVPLLTEYLKSNPLPSGVDLYTVSTNVTAKRPNYPPSAWLKKEGWTAKTLADSENQDAADAFGLTAFPYFVAVDGSGKVVARTSGEITTGQFAALAQQTLGNR